MSDPVSRILALDAALGQCSAALLADGQVLAERVQHGERGQVQRLAPMLREVLDAGGTEARALDAVAVTLGPGSFTGLRAALALAHGLALAAGVTLIGVTVFEALAAALGRGGRWSGDLGRDRQPARAGISRSRGRAAQRGARRIAPAGGSGGDHG